MIAIIRIEEPQSLAIKPIPTAAERANFTVDQIHLTARGTIRRENGALQFVLPETGQSFSVETEKEDPPTDKSTVISGTFTGITEGEPSLRLTGR